MQWFLLALKRYIEFTGRSRRKEYWMFYLWCMIISIPLSIVDAFVSTISESGVGFLSTLFSIFTFIPWVSIFVRRLHDIDKSGWYLLLIFLPIIGWIWLFILSITNGDEGENKYGPDPKSTTSELDEIGIKQVKYLK